jgi:hypothetical protein
MNHYPIRDILRNSGRQFPELRVTEKNKNLKLLTVPKADIL